jgi:hypothetical protein
MGEIAAVLLHRLVFNAARQLFGRSCFGLW